MSLLRVAITRAPTLFSRLACRLEPALRCQTPSSAPAAPVWRLGIAPCYHNSAFLRENAAKAQQQEEDDAAEQMSPPSDRVVALADEIIQLSMIDVVQLTRILKKKLGIPEMVSFGMAPMQAGPGGPAADAAPKVEEVAEKTAFDVKLDSYDQAQRIKLIKEVRAVTSLGLKEAKDLVEKVPTVLKAGVAKAEAEAIMEKLKAVGGTCSME